MPDAVLDAGVGLVPGFEERELAGGRVGRDHLIAPAAGLFEERQQDAEMRAFSTNDDPHPLGPARGG